MSRISLIVGGKEYGRRLYASDKGYTDQMKEVTDKAMLDQAPYHLSEFKKPYLADSYEEMEHMYSPMGGPILPVILPPEGNPESKTVIEDMRWKTEPPEQAEKEAIYLIRVWNRVKSSTTIQGGKVTKKQRTYYPARLELKNLTAMTKGLTLEMHLPRAVFDVVGQVMGFYGSSYGWYNVQTHMPHIVAVLQYMRDKGTVPPVTTARLVVSNHAKGSARITAKDNYTTLAKKVTVKSDAITSDYWYMVYDSMGAFLGYVPCGADLTPDVSKFVPSISEAGRIVLSRAGCSYFSALTGPIGGFTVTSYATVKGAPVSGTYLLTGSVTGVDETHNGNILNMVDVGGIDDVAVNAEVCSVTSFSGTASILFNYNIGYAIGIARGGSFTELSSAVVTITGGVYAGLSGILAIVSGSLFTPKQMVRYSDAIVVFGRNETDVAHSYDSITYVLLTPSGNVKKTFAGSGAMIPIGGGYYLPCDSSCLLKNV